MFEVYIHVPFCLRRCGYCDFNTYTATDLGAGASRGNYANMVIREMKSTKQWQLDHGIAEPPVSTVFFGGGTPTILAARDLVAMLDAIRKTWGIASNAEITTEANPDTVNEYYINELAAGGFTRVSFGMQSAVPHVLKTLDRTHTPANVAAGVNAANKAGLRSSVDLIYGAPGESLDDWRTSVTTAIDLGVNHISAYALTVEPTTKMGRQIAAGTLPKPNDDDEAAKYEIADDLFAAAGLEWYEVSNWARPGYESQHNLGYWRNVDWAGVGPGAHSHYNNVTEIDRPQSALLTAPASGGKLISGEVGVGLFDGEADAFDLFTGQRCAERHTQCRFSNGWFEPHSQQSRRNFVTSNRAGRTGRSSDAACIQIDEQGFAGDAGEDERGVARQATLGVAGQVGAGSHAANRVNEHVTGGNQFAIMRLHARIRLIEPDGERHCTGHVLCA